MHKVILFCSLFLVGSISTAQVEDLRKGNWLEQRSHGDDEADVGKVSIPVPAGRTRIVNAQPSESDGALRSPAIVGSNEFSAPKQAVEPAPMSEFQKFVFEGTGKNLPIFGHEFFDKTPSTFAPVQNAPVPSEYSLGPGDEVLIRGWGTIDIDYRATIDRNGLINIPTVGTVSLSGVRAANAEAVVRSAVGRLYKGVTLSVTFGQLRAITVYVVGQARRPGTYTVGSTSSLVTALFASGGPSAAGSMRRVQVKRGGTIVGDLDLYQFIAKGDKSGDIRLLDGDTIYIPPAVGHVALVGSVDRPAIYELRGPGDTIQSLLDIAGGIPVIADPRRAFLERIDPSKARPRSVDEFALDNDGMRRLLKNGDLLNITSITPNFADVVVLRGKVDQSVRAPFKPGMRVSDLIPNREYLVSRGAVKRQNDVIDTGENEKASGVAGSSIASEIGGLIDEINWDYAVVERINRKDLTVDLIPFNLGNVFSNPAGPDNLPLVQGDTVTIFSQKDIAVPIDKRRVIVRIEGEVAVPGVYQMTAGDNIHSLLARAGGPTNNAYLFGTSFYREQVRREQEANLIRSASRLETELSEEQATMAANSGQTGDAMVAEMRQQAGLKSAKAAIARLRQMKPTGRVTLGLDAADRSFNRLPALRLEDGDRLVVPARPQFVHVFGSVNVEASLLWKNGTLVSDYLKLVGVTRGADLDNVFVLRADGSVISRSADAWYSNSVDRLAMMPGDAIIIPEKLDKETRWSKFMQGAREWTQMFANFGLGAAAIKTLRN